MREVYNILEVANTHGGSIKYVFLLLDEFSQFQENFGIKFQPFKYDLIALEDYEWYETYKKLFIDEEDWIKIIKKANETKDVWIDVFDSYSVKILEENILYIKGIKFQASTLNNLELIQKLSKIDLKEKYLILNIAGHSLKNIKKILNNIKRKLSHKEIILQIGFQDYPTRIEDSGLSKIQILKDNFDQEISFTDHISYDDEQSLYLPIIANILGAKYIEKHIKSSKLETEFDTYSSIDKSLYKKYYKLQKMYKHTLSQDFINKSEEQYLSKTLQIPILKKEKSEGDLLNIKKDLSFKRTEQKGLKISEINDFLKNKKIIKEKIGKNKTLKKKDFRDSQIATIIACRLKSSRLPKKAILKIGDVSSIELCIKNALKFKGVDKTILATSTLEQDSELKDYTYDNSVIFHRGDPIDVIQRYIDAIDKYDIDIVVRITGDMPYVSNEIFQILIREHFRKGADYTTAKKAAVGTNLEIINSNALKKIKSFFPSADYSEYMTYYFTNNPDYFNLNFVDLPPELVRDYRLTLDYEKDLIMFRKIEEYLKENNIEYNLRELFKLLDNNKDLAKINSSCTLKYKTDKELIKKLKEKTTIKK